jgi:spoIIIJ-associated protein
MANTPHFSPVRLKASSEEAAISQALMMVGATRDDVEVEVLEKTDKGVTVRVSPRRSNAEATDALSTSTPATSTSAAVAPVEEEAPAASQDAFEETEEEVIEAPDYDEEGAYANEAAEALEAETEAAPTGFPVREADPAQAQRAQELAQEFLERMGLEATVNIVPPPSSAVEEVASATPIVYLDIEGEDVGILIGKHGQTLQSFQYLVNLTLNNRVHESDGDEQEALRVILDAGGYRLRRAQSLEQAARNAASRAKRDRRSIRLDPMPAHERRLVHIALRGDSEISTGSEGREPHRYVVVSPANRGNGYSGGQGGQGSREGGRSRGPRRSSYGSGSGGFGGRAPRREG